MIRTTLQMTLRPGEGPALVQTFQRLAILETARAQDGCGSAEICLSDDGSHALVTATWRDQAAYDRWTSRDDRGGQSGALNVHLAEPLSAEAVGHVYRVAHAPGD